MARPRNTDPERERRPSGPPANFAARLALGGSYTRLAEEFAVHRITIGTWAQLPEVQEELARIQRESSDEALRKLESYRVPALSTLASVLNTGVCDKCGRGAAEVRDRIRAATELLNRLEGLEERMNIHVSGTLGHRDDTDPEAALRTAFGDEAVDKMLAQPANKQIEEDRK